MRNLRYIALLISLAAAALGVVAQKPREVLAKAGETGVWVRWTAPEFAHRGGVNVYRRAAGTTDWQKLTAAPFGFSTDEPGAEIKTDPLLYAGVESLKKMRSGETVEGITKLLVLVPMLESRPFAEFAGLLYHDKTASARTIYEYEVRAVRGQGEESYGISNAVEAGKFVPETALQNVEFKAKKKSIKFGWKPEPDRLPGAYVYVKTNRDRDWKRMPEQLILPSYDSESGTYYKWHTELKNLEEGKTYTFRIAGVDRFGFESEFSEEIVIEIKDETPPPAPQEFTVTETEGEARLKWTMQAVPDLEGFHIYRRTGDDTTWTKLTVRPLGSGARLYTDRSCEAARFYTYQLAAVDRAGNETRSREKYISIPDRLPPKRVIGLRAVADTGVVKLSWFPNSEPDLMGYRVYRIAQKPGSAQQDTMLLTAFIHPKNEFTDSLPKIAKNKFAYTVVAIDSFNNISRHCPQVITQLPDPLPPGPPFLKSIRLEGEALRLTWLPNLDSDLAGYQLYRSENPEAPASEWKPLAQGMLSARDTTYLDRTCEAGTGYYYRLAAFDDSGNRSADSETYMGTVNRKKVKAGAQKVVAEYNKRKKLASLHWEAPDDDQTIGFMVYRRQGRATFLPVSGLISEKKFVDKSAQPEQLYYYEVRTFDAVGNFAHSRPVKLETK